MPKRQSLLFSLKRKRIRASLNKFNLYNAITWRKITRRGTLYQQKWEAKQETRAYHGESLTETQFRNIFTGELNAVNPLRSTKIISKSEENESARKDQLTPWAMQTYGAIERRLDTAMFRSFFAASPRQAAQFIVKGRVHVNGVKIKQPSYELKPGDVFSVDPERVLYALGRQKPSVKESVELVNRQIKRYNDYLKRCHKYPEKMWRLRQKHRRRHVIFNKLHMKKQQKRNEAWNKMVNKNMSEAIDALTPKSIMREILQQEKDFHDNSTLPLKPGPILNKSLSVLSLVTGKRVNLSGSNEPAREVPKEETEEQKHNVEMKSEEEPVVTGGKSRVETKPEEPVSEEKSEAEPKQETAEAAQEVEEASSEFSSESSSATTSKTESADSTRINNLIDQYYGKVDNPPGNKSDVKKLVQDIIKLKQEDLRQTYTSQIRPLNQTEEKYNHNWVKALPEPVPLVELSAAEEDLNSVLPVKLPFSNGKLYGLADPLKGYFTPWTPRPFITPFAVLPHHIEISFKTCHAVYLRDPVARPGHSEIISPLPLDMHERAYMFYIRKRRKYI